MNRVIVEGKNDKAFIIAVKNYLQQRGFNLQFDLSQLRNGLNQKNIEKELEELRDDLFSIKSNTINLGFILDIDNPNQEDYIERETIVLSSLKKIFAHLQDANFSQLPISFTEKNRQINISIFLNKDSTGRGELMNILREIKKQDSSIADCIENCCKAKEDYHQKTFDDDWSHFYMKWDCNNLENRSSSTNFSFEKISQIQMEKFWNFESEILNPLKQYLTQFQ